MGEKMQQIRNDRGIFTIEELSAMFKMGRQKIDDALNDNKLDYISPNNKQRFIRLEDFEKWAENKQKNKEK